MVTCINRKKPWQPSYNDGSATCNLTERFVDEPVTVNGVTSRITCVRLVDMSKEVRPMPTAKEYDLEQMLKAGVHPNQINVHGMLGQEFDVDEAMDMLNRYVEKKSSKLNKSTDVSSDNVES